MLWENIGLNRRVMGRTNCCINTVIILLLLFLFTPTFLVTILAHALSGIGMAMEIIIMNLPALIILLYMEVIIPLVIEKMVAREKHYVRSEALRSEVSKYLLILIFLVFGIGLVGLQIIGVLLAWAWDDWLPTFGKEIVLTGDFFTVLMMQLTFISNGMALLCLGKWIKGIAREKLAKTELETKKAWGLNVWELGRQYSQTATVFIVCLSYSLIIPYMVLIAAIYFAIKYIYSKNLLLTVCYIEADSRGKVSKCVLKALLICVSIFWFISGVMLQTTGEPGYVGLGTFILICSVVSIVLLLCFEERIWALK